MIPKFRPRAGRLAAATTFVIALLAACAKPPAPPPPPPPPPPPTVISLSIQGSPMLNPDVRQRASPVVVRVYELKSPAVFDSADFIALFNSDQATLGGDVVTREEFVLQPGETKMVEKNAASDTRVVAVTAQYRQIERARWRTWATIKPNTRNRLVLRVEESGLALAPAP